MILHGLVVVELNTLRRHWTRTHCLGRGSPGRRYPTCPAGSTTGRAGRWGPKTCIKEHNTGKFKKDVELKPEIRNIMIMNLFRFNLPPWFKTCVWRWPAHTSWSVWWPPCWCRARHCFRQTRLSTWRCQGDCPRYSCSPGWGSCL